ncbi:helix-turn-helix domain-containing protein [Geodermatophilus nigrescens]
MDTHRDARRHHMTSTTGRSSASDLMTLAETAAYLRTPVATLRYWRHLGEGPAGFRLGRRVMFKRADVDAWLDARRRTETH